MTRNELADHIAGRAGITSATAREWLDHLAAIVTDVVSGSEEIDLGRALGKFTVVERAARAGRNPRTGEAIDIPAQRTVKFRPAKRLLDALEPRYVAPV